MSAAMGEDMNRRVAHKDLGTKTPAVTGAGTS